MTPDRSPSENTVVDTATSVTDSASLPVPDGPSRRATATLVTPAAAIVATCAATLIDAPAARWRGGRSARVAATAPPRDRRVHVVPGVRHRLGAVPRAHERGGVRAVEPAQVLERAVDSRGERIRVTGRHEHTGAPLTDLDGHPDCRCHHGRTSGK